MHVRDQLRIVQTYDSNPVVLLFDCTAGACSPYTSPLDKTDGGDFYVVLQDIHGNMAPAGTTLTVNGEGYKIRGDDGVVNNTIGKLGGAGLPEFGMLYRVEYEPELSPKIIELEADNNGQITRVYLK